MRATREIRAGCVWVNDHIPIISEMPHGGYKDSGYGKDMSMYSLEEYTNVKHVMYDGTAAVRKDWHRTVFTGPRPLRPPAEESTTTMSDIRHDPRFREIVRAQLSRRTLLRGAGGVGVAAALAACGTGGDDATGTEARRRPSRTSPRPTRWCAGRTGRPTSTTTRTPRSTPRWRSSSSETGIKATYAEDIDDNDSYYGKVQGQLKNGDDIGKDVIIMTDWMAGRLIRQGYVQKLDKANIPNAKNLNPKLQDVDFDPGRSYSLTWQSGYAGIGYRKDKVGRELKTIEDLWAPDLKGKIVVLSEMRDTVGLIMLAQGVDISKDFTEDDFNKGTRRAAEAGRLRPDPPGQGQLLPRGPAQRQRDRRASRWSGDILLARFEEEDDNYTFTIPESGGTLWSDNLMVPIASPHKTNAEKLIDFYYDPAVAAEVAAYVNYICPVEGAKEEMEKIDPSLADSPLIFPTAEDLANVKVFRSLTPDEEIDLLRGVPEGDRQLMAGTGETGGRDLRLERRHQAFGSFVAVDDLS